ncbi:MAG TPA: phospho-N-acetylmuramoyl-pentapeptide-transferase [Candidatus Edwardsbacteria bacterium]|nr:phospho-N-acetylmuramoyl-pentapeptide-transferase [Candidatus Edwardsbacteria bacterium]
MLYLLLYPLAEKVHFFNLFRYITFRSAYALVTALLISFLIGPAMIRQLKRLQIVDGGREDAPAQHQAKAGTPTMGGLVILAAIIIPVLLWADLGNRYIQVSLFATVGLGLIGFYDDYLKVVKKNSKGLVGRWKLAGQFAVALLIALYLQLHPMNPEFATKTSFLFMKNVFIDLAWFYIPFVMLVIVFTSNAVNLTDGLDGLAIGVFLFSAAAYAVMSYITGNFKLAEYLNILFMRGSGELTVLGAAMVGASLGFLWFNAHPAEVFMGDAGALALGGVIGTMAVLIKQEILLGIVGGVFVMEAASVILQVASFQSTGRRIFRMTPIHHHFQKLGWSEQKIVVRFWIIAFICALVALSTLKIR